jgi:hypothetical protein
VGDSQWVGQVVELGGRCNIWSLPSTDLFRSSNRASAISSLALSCLISSLISSSRSLAADEASARGARECTQGGTQNFSLGREPVRLSVSVRAAAFYPKMIGTFTDRLFQILHHQLS